MTSKNKRAELYEDLEQHVIGVLQREGVASETAKQIASEVADSLATHWGGQIISFPRDLVRSRGELHKKIVSRFNGRNYGELANEFGYTERGIRKLIERAGRKGH